MLVRRLTVASGNLACNVTKLFSFEALGALVTTTLFWYLCCVVDVVAVAGMGIGFARLVVATCADVVVVVVVSVSSAAATSAGVDVVVANDAVVSDNGDDDDTSGC